MLQLAFYTPTIIENPAFPGMGAFLGIPNTFYDRLLLDGHSQTAGNYDYSSYDPSRLSFDFDQGFIAPYILSDQHAPALNSSNTSVFNTSSLFFIFFKSVLYLGMSFIDAISNNGSLSLHITQNEHCQKPVRKLSCVPDSDKTPKFPSP